MPNIIQLPHRFTPRDYQKPPFRALFNEGKKRFMCIWHRRAGKDNTWVNLIIAAAQQRVGLYLYMLPELAQAKKVIWKGRSKDGTAFLDHFPPELVKSINNTDLRIEFKNGSIFQLGGSDRYDSWMGTNPIGIVRSEHALSNPAADDYFAPILAENDGWIAYITTPRGKNHTYELFERVKENPKWHVEVLTVNDTKREGGTPVITQDAIEQEILEGRSDEIIQQEYYCSFEGAIEGAYYAKQMKQAELQGRICDFAIEPALPVYTFWDLGVADAMAIWVMQPFRNELRMIGYYENSGEGFVHYINWLKDFRDTHNISFQRHYAPHDIEVRTLGAEAKSRYEIAKGLGIKFDKTPNISIMDGIEALRMLMPRMWFHKTNCKQGIRALKEYKKEYDQKRHCYKDNPLHDWASHGADAARYLGVAWRDKVDNSNKPSQRKMPGFNPMG